MHFRIRLVELINLSGNNMVFDAHLSKLLYEPCDVTNRIFEAIWREKSPTDRGLKYIFVIVGRQRLQNTNLRRCSNLFHEAWFWGPYFGPPTAKSPITKFKTAHSILRKNSAIDSDGQIFRSNLFHEDVASSHSNKRAQFKWPSLWPSEQCVE